MGRKKNPTSEMDVGEKMKTPLAQNLDKLITDANALKDYLGCSIQAINQYRLGVSRPSLENLCKIADFYGVSTDYLLGLSDIPTNRPDIQAACLTTGLSVAAIQAIAGSSQIDEYNYLLTLDSFERFLNFLHEYKEHWNNLLKSEVWQHQQADACSKEGKCFAYIDPESSIHAKMLRCAKLDLHECISAITDAIDATYQNRKEGE